MKTYQIVSKLGTVVMISEKEFLEFVRNLGVLDPEYYCNGSYENFGSFQMRNKEFYLSDGSLVAMIHEIED